MAIKGRYTVTYVCTRQGRSEGGGRGNLPWAPGLRGAPKIQWRKIKDIMKKYYQTAVEFRWYCD